MACRHILLLLMLQLKITMMNDFQIVGATYISISFRKTYLTKLLAFIIYYRPHVLFRTIVYDR